MTPQAQQWLRLPLELRQRPQWLLAGPNDKGELKVPTTVNAAGRLVAGSSTDKSKWLDFERALGYATEYGYGLGYVLSADDPYTCIDFDLYTPQNAPNEPDKWSTPEEFELCKRIATTFGSFTEYSQSGIGAHTWLRGKIGVGRQRRPVALYSQERFIACTGNVIFDAPIVDGQAMLANMASQMDAEAENRGKKLDELEQEIPDDELMRRAWAADNRDKFQQLWRGEWQAMGYPSQSEADLSLMSMLTFYSRSNEQCRRIFRQSALGAREKALKNDKYLDYTLRLIRGRQAKQDQHQAAIAAQAAAFVRQTYQQSPQPQSQPAAPGPDEAALQAQVAAAHAYAAQLQAQAAQQAAANPMPQPTRPELPPEGGLAWPPGFVSEIAKFIYYSSPRPVKEVSIVAAIGLMAGLCGKVWNIPGSGLNLYIILVARSAVGKEAMHTGLGAIVSRMRFSQPIFGNFVDFSDFASGPALAKACAQNSSFVNVAGEFGHKLKRLANNANDGPMQSLRTVMTNLYQKSGPTSIVGGITYSNKDSNVASISGVAYSMIGETTPDKLYASLTDDMMEDGFLSRFTIVEYDGQRPPLNANPNTEVPNFIVDKLSEIAQISVNSLANHNRIILGVMPEAWQAMQTFDAECDAQINSTKDETQRQMWNRAYLKAARIAGLLCIGDNPAVPCIHLHHWEWAIDLIRRDIALMQRKMSAGEVGKGDNARERKVLHLIHEFMSNPVPASYGIPQQMQRDGVVPRKYLQTRAYNLSVFSTHAWGAKRALDEAISSCIDNGYIVEMPKEKAGEAYTFMGRCFRIVNLPKFN